MRKQTIYLVTIESTFYIGEKVRDSWNAGMGNSLSVQSYSDLWVPIYTKFLWL